MRAGRARALSASTSHGTPAGATPRALAEWLPTAAIGDLVLNPYDELLCSVHGWRSHVFTHEAAHAVAAIDRGFAFEHVTIDTPDQWAAVNPNQLRLGGVQMSGPSPEWVMPDPIAALEYVLAGSEAEKLVYGHHLQDSYQGDLMVFAEGFDATGRDTSGGFDTMVGMTLEEAQQRSRAWVAEAFPRIRSVALALAGMDSSATSALIDDDAGPWSLTYDEVREIAVA